MGIIQLTSFNEYGIHPFCNQLELHFNKFYYGRNSGKWKSCFPLNRLVCILESDGDSSFQHRNDTVPLKRDTAVLLPAFHEITHDQNESLLLLSIHFNLELYYGIDLLEQRKRMWHEVNRDRCDLIRQMLEKPTRLNMTASLRTLCWDAILRCLPGAPELEKNHLPSYTRYEPLFAFLQRNTYMGIDIAQMAEVMRMNRETFIKKVTADTGESPKLFFNRLLARRAAHLLSGGERNIREVADELKFCSEFYFSRFFRRHFGVSPREFRKNGPPV